MKRGHVDDLCVEGKDNDRVHLKNRMGWRGLDSSGSPPERSGV